MDGANVALASSTRKTSSLVPRTISAVILIPILIIPVYWGVWSTALLVAVATIISLTELYSVLRHAGYQPRYVIGSINALLLCGAATLQGQVPIDLMSVAVGSSIMLALLSEMPRPDRKRSLPGWAFTFVSAYYIGGLLSHYILLRRIDAPLNEGPLSFLNIPPGAAWIYTVMAITWLQDTAAYFVGRTYGRHQMAPILSPKKSWEGAAGGLLMSIAAAMLAAFLLGLPISYTAAAIIGVIGGIAGQLGDLGESLIKRQIGIKDASHLIPGHGGILDRADSMLFTAPVIYYCCLFVLTVPL